LTSRFDDFTGLRAEWVLVDAMLADQAARVPSGAIQPWWIWLDGYQRSATINSPQGWLVL
jgi:hypothetical protein